MVLGTGITMVNKTDKIISLPSPFTPSGAYIPQLPLHTSRIPFQLLTCTWNALLAAFPILKFCNSLQAAFLDIPLSSALLSTALGWYHSRMGRIMADLPQRTTTHQACGFLFTNPRCRLHSEWGLR